MPTSHRRCRMPCTCRPISTPVWECGGHRSMPTGRRHVPASPLSGRTTPPMAFPWERFPWGEAMISYTRALGAAHTGDTAGAATEIAKLQSLKQKLDQAKDDYWAKQVEVQRLAASGILAHAQGDNQKA